MSENKIILTQTQAETFCDHYCRYPFEWDEEKEGCALAESDICKNCPLEKAIKAAVDKKKRITNADNCHIDCVHYNGDDECCIMCNAANGWKYYEGASGWASYW